MPRILKQVTLNEGQVNAVVNLDRQTNQAIQQIVQQGQQQLSAKLRSYVEAAGEYPSEGTWILSQDGKSMLKFGSPEEANEMMRGYVAQAEGQATADALPDSDEQVPEEVLQKAEELGINPEEVALSELPQGEMPQDAECVNCPDRQCGDCPRKEGE